jgi:hypothetical protein
VSVKSGEDQGLSNTDPQSADPDLRVGIDRLEDIQAVVKRQRIKTENHLESGSLDRYFLHQSIRQALSGRFPYIPLPDIVRAPDLRRLASGALSPH